MRKAIQSIPLLAVLVFPVLAQTNFGRISGTVTDPSGAAVPGAKVTIRDVDTQATRSLTSDSNGAYVAQNLPIGPYSITVEASGFKTTSRSGFQLGL
jgi:hypothetical protein